MKKAVITTLMQAVWARYGQFIATVVVSALGSGAVWQLLDWRSSERTMDIEVLRVSFDMRGKLNELLGEVLELRNLQLVLSSCNPQDVEYSVPEHSLRLKQRLELISDDIASVEKRLAKVEGRSAREFQVLQPGLPMAPVLLSVTSTVDNLTDPIEPASPERKCPADGYVGS